MKNALLTFACSLAISGFCSATEVTSLVQTNQAAEVQGLSLSEDFKARLDFLQNNRAEAEQAKLVAVAKQLKIDAKIILDEAESLLAQAFNAKVLRSEAIVFGRPIQQNYKLVELSNGAQCKLILGEDTSVMAHCLSQGGQEDFFSINTQPKVVEDLQRKR